MDSKEIQALAWQIYREAVAEADPGSVLARELEHAGLLDRLTGGVSRKSGGGG